MEAARALSARIDASPALRSIFSEGKMLGVLLTDRGSLEAFSGLAGGHAVLDGFVPPIFNYSDPSGYFKLREAEISAMPDGIAKSHASARLQDWLFEQYRVLNARGECLSVKEIFARRGMVPPGGTGECAAPKLLQHAYLHGMKPLAMGEFWYGASHCSEVREHGRFYPACFGKCGPLLTFMTEGLEMEPNPLDREYEGAEPEILHADRDIIVVNKPAGMLSVPGRTGVKSLLDLLSEQYGEVHSCHRLDMDTSGVMVFARNLRHRRPAAHAGLLRQAEADRRQGAREAGGNRVQGSGDSAGRGNRHPLPPSDRTDPPAESPRRAPGRSRQTDKGRPSLRRLPRLPTLPSR